MNIYNVPGSINFISFHTSKQSWGPRACQVLSWCSSICLLLHANVLLFTISLSLKFDKGNRTGFSSVGKLKEIQMAK